MISKNRFSMEPLGEQHDRAAFSCGVDPLDDYFQRQAGQDQKRDVARVFVAVDDRSGAVAGFYTLSSIGIDVGELPDERARKLPRYPIIPAVLIGRLAVGTDYQGQRLGEFILMDALKRITDHSNELGIYAVVVEAKDERAASFYERYGFIAFPSGRRRLFLPMATIRPLFE